VIFLPGLAAALGPLGAAATAAAETGHLSRRVSPAPEAPGSAPAARGSPSSSLPSWRPKAASTSPGLCTSCPCAARRARGRGATPSRRPHSADTNSRSVCTAATCCGVGRAAASLHRHPVTSKCQRRKAAAAGLYRVLPACAPRAAAAPNASPAALSGARVVNPSSSLKKPLPSPAPLPWGCRLQGSGAPPGPAPCWQALPSPAQPALTPVPLLLPSSPLPVSAAACDHHGHQGQQVLQLLQLPRGPLHGLAAGGVAFPEGTQSRSSGPPPTCHSHQRTPRATDLPPTSSESLSSCPPQEEQRPRPAPSSRFLSPPSRAAPAPGHGGRQQALKEADAAPQAGADLVRVQPWALFEDQLQHGLPRGPKTPWLEDQGPREPSRWHHACSAGAPHHVVGVAGHRVRRGAMRRVRRFEEGGPTIWAPAALKAPPGAPPGPCLVLQKGGKANERRNELLFLGCGSCLIARALHQALAPSSSAAHDGG